MFLDSVKYNNCSTFNTLLVCVRKLTHPKMLPTILQECWAEAITPSSIKSKHLLCDRCSKFNLQFGEFPNVVLCAANAKLIHSGGNKANTSTTRSLTPYESSSLPATSCPSRNLGPFSWLGHFACICCTLTSVNPFFSAEDCENDLFRSEKCGAKISQLTTLV
jgi:hypothetical protein